VKPVILRVVAERFLESELDNLVDRGEIKTAAGMVAALSKLKTAISAYPDIGSPRYADLLNLPGLRHRQLGRYAYQVFYMERGAYIDIWQILHDRMDILNRLHDPDAPEGADGD
jgi:toxin ParE1/3/4